MLINCYFHTLVFRYIIFSARNNYILSTIEFKMTKNNILLLILLAIITCTTTSASDIPLQDFCVADFNSPG